MAEMQESGELFLNVFPYTEQILGQILYTLILSVFVGYTKIIFACLACRGSIGYWIGQNFYPILTST